MGKTLILAEKESVGEAFYKALKDEDRTLKKKKGYYVGSKYIITWGMGHLVDLDTEAIAGKEWDLEKLPVIPKDSKDWKYKIVSKSAGRQFRIIKELLKGSEGKVDKVVISTDAGREGELIARLILQRAGWKDWDKVYRFWTSEVLTPDVIKREMRNLKEAKLFNNLYFSALGRQRGDWLVGINGTRALTKKAQEVVRVYGREGVWSIGRVQTALLKLIKDREEEIKNFVPEPYFLVQGIFENGGIKGFLLEEGLKRDIIFVPKKGKVVEEGEEVEEDGREDSSSESSEKNTKSRERTAKIKPEKIREVMSELEEALKKNGGKGVVIELKRKEKREKPPLLHSLASLQREANKLYRFSLKETHDIAQVLYEKNYIGYPRTDSQYLPRSSVGRVKEILKALGRGELVKRVDVNNKRVFNDKKLTDHYALIPFKKGDNLKGKEKLIYDLIWRRFVGAFMPDYRYEEITAKIKVGNFVFKVSGKKDIELGWKALYKKDKGEDMVFEALGKWKKGEKVPIKDVKPLKEETKPPARYTEGSLVKLMERLNLGKASTRDGFTETLKKRGYIAIQGKKKEIYITEKGRKVVEVCERLDLPVIDIQLTSAWEKELSEIEEKGWKVYERFIKDVSVKTEEIVKKIKEMNASNLKLEISFKGSSFQKSKGNKSRYGYKSGYKSKYGKKERGRTKNKRNTKMNK